MSRIRIEPTVSFQFSTEIPVRITDLNYGGHVGNDSILSIIHEARVQFFVSKGYQELDLGGTGLIMTDAGIEFKQEIFYGELIRASVAAGGFTRVGFDLFYRLEKKTAAGLLTAILAKTGMVCYDYARKKIVFLPEAVRQQLAG
jgi:acyl-CoA thioester hydrolase